MNAVQKSALKAIESIHGKWCWVGEHKGHGNVTVLVYYSGFAYTISSSGSLQLYVREAQ